MNNDEKVLKAIEGINTRLDQQGKALETLQGDVTDVKADVTDVKQGQARLEARIAEVKLEQGEVRQGQAQIKTVVEATHAGQEDIRDKMATEASVMDFGAKVNRVIRNHERRIEQLEEKTHTSYKN
jgi:chromosome segregation ATPase